MFCGNPEIVVALWGYITSKPLKRQPHKMVKHSQTIRRQKLTNYLSVFDHFVGLMRKGLRR